MKHLALILMTACNILAQEKKVISIYQCCNHLDENVQLRIEEEGKRTKSINVNAKQNQLFFFAPNFKVSILNSNQTTLASLEIQNYSDNVINIEKINDQVHVFTTKKPNETIPLLMNYTPQHHQDYQSNEFDSNTKKKCCRCQQQ